MVSGELRIPFLWDPHFRSHIFCWTFDNLWPNLWSKCSMTWQFMCGQCTYVSSLKTESLVNWMLCFFFGILDQRISKLPTLAGCWDDVIRCSKSIANYQRVSLPNFFWGMSRPWCTGGGYLYILYVGLDFPFFLCRCFVESAWCFVAAQVKRWDWPWWWRQECPSDRKAGVSGYKPRGCSLSHDEDTNISSNLFGYMIYSWKTCIWLVVWNMFFFPSSQLTFIFQRVFSTTNQE